MNRRERDIRKMIDKVGLQCQCLELSGKNHYKAHIVGPTGGVRMVVFSGTPSDCRADRNHAALLRRLAAGLPL